MAEIGRRCTVVLPMLNEAATIERSLQALQAWRHAGHEVLVVDGGSSDGSKALAAPLVDQLLDSDAGRATQMNTGARHATGDWLFFLHADTCLPAAALESLCAHLPDEGGWGFCHVRLSGKQYLLRIIERAMLWRARLTEVATGDMGLLVHRNLFELVGGFPPIPLMEDVALCKRLRRHQSPCVLPLTLTTDSRRWERQGIVRTTLLMWRLRLAYFLGVSPARLVKHYYPARAGQSHPDGHGD